ncbi:hypothetical protein CLU79DRAFT_781271 [Phycomyces nitens]|nr:hypothetical protein CLU79DRAFT_781271 [Phycomyces nitens]
MSEPAEYYDTIDLHIRWSDRQDLVLSVSPHDTISTVKQKICQMSPHAKGKYIRLIHSGRILEDNNTPSDYGLGKMTSDGSKSKMDPLPVYIHCSLSEYVPDQTATKAQPTPNTPATGFDRLRESGFTEDDIQNIRSQFHRLHGTPVEGDNEEARNLEEQWMDNTTDTLPDGSKISLYYYCHCGYLVYENKLFKGHIKRWFGGLCSDSFWGSFVCFGSVKMCFLEDIKWVSWQVL